MNKIQSIKKKYLSNILFGPSIVSSKEKFNLINSMLRKFDQPMKYFYYKKNKSIT